MIALMCRPIMTEIAIYPRVLYTPLFDSLHIRTYLFSDYKCAIRMIKDCTQCIYYAQYWIAIIVKLV